MPVSFVLTGRVINSVGSNPFDTQRLIEQVDQVSATSMQRPQRAVLQDMNYGSLPCCMFSRAWMPASASLPPAARATACAAGLHLLTQHQHAFSCLVGRRQHLKSSPLLQACLFMVYLAIVAVFASSMEVIPWMVTGGCSPPVPAVT